MNILDDDLPISLSRLASKCYSAGPCLAEGIGKHILPGPSKKHTLKLQPNQPKEAQGEGWERMKEKGKKQKDEGTERER